MYHVGMRGFDPKLPWGWGKFRSFVIARTAGKIGEIGAYLLFCIS